MPFNIKDLSNSRRNLRTFRCLSLLWHNKFSYARTFASIFSDLSKYSSSIVAGCLFTYFALDVTAKSPQFTIVWSTENFDSTAKVLMDENGVRLTSGPEGNQNGTLLELGYFLDQNQNFVKTSNFAEVNTWRWIPLTTRTYVGDSSSGYGFDDGMFAFTTTFTQDSEQIINYYTEPRQFTEILEEPVTTSNPENGTQLFIRFYDKFSTDPALRKYNTVTGTLWRWPGFPSGGGIPENFYIKITDLLDEDSKWKQGATFQSDGDNAFKTVLRERFHLNATVKTGDSYLGSGAASVQGGDTSGEFDAGLVNITAEANANNSFFMYWEGDGITNANSPNTTVYLNKDTNVTAVFSKNIYNLDVTVIGDGKVYLSNDEIDEIELDENYMPIYNHGDPANLRAEASNGNEFKYWALTSSPAEIISTDLEYNETVEGNTQLVAVFEPKVYSLSYAPQESNTGDIKIFNDDTGELIEFSEGSNGTKLSSITHGMNYEIRAEPAQHYLFEKWSWGNGQVSPLLAGSLNNNPAARISPTSDLSLTAEFQVMNYKLKILKTDGGSTSPASSTSNPYYFAADSNINVTAEPLEGYEFVNWVDPFSILDDALSSNTAAQISKINANEASITAVFSPKQYDDDNTFIQVNWDHSHGDVNLQKNISGKFTHFEKYSLVATPTKGYRFLEWNGTGSSNLLTYGKFEKNNELLIQGSPVDVNLTALFEPSEFFIDVNSSPNYAGEVVGAGGFSILDTPSLTAIAHPGFKFTGWSGNTDYLSDINSSTTFVRTDDRNFSFTANFRAIDFNVTITAMEGGTFNAYYENFGDQFAFNAANHTESLGYSQSFSVSVSENDGWLFDQWLNLPSDQLAQKTSPSLSNIDVLSDLSFSAKFKRIPYSLDLNNTLGGSVTGTGIYEFEEDVNISATPEEHFTFSKWNVYPNGTDTSFISPTLANQTITIPSSLPSSGTTLEAEFAPNSYQIIASSSNSFHGKISLSSTFSGNTLTSPEYTDVPSISSQFNASSEIVINASPENDDYIFSHFTWSKSDGTTRELRNDSMRIPYLDDHYNIQAIFSSKPDSYIEFNATASPLWGGYIESNDSLSTSSSQKLTAFPYPGYSFIGWEALDDSNNSIDISPHWTATEISLNITPNSKVVAHFEKNDYFLYIDLNDSRGSVSGNQTSYDFSERAIISANPDSSFSFTGWEVDLNQSSQPISVTKSFSNIQPLDSRLFVNDNEAPVLELIRGFTYRFDYSFSDSGAFIFLSTSAEAEEDKNYTTGVIHAPDSNQLYFTVANDAPDSLFYHFSAGPYLGNQIMVTDLNESHFIVSPDQSNIQPSITKNIKVRANFELTPLSITSSTYGQGTVEITNHSPHHKGDEIEILATPSPNWNFVRWENDSLVNDPYDANTSFTLESDIELIAIFELGNYELSLPVEPAGFGTARTQFNAFKFGWGETVRIIAEPRTGKIFQHWLFEDNTTISDKSLDIVIQKNTSITAVFSPRTFQVNLSLLTLDENGTELENIDGGTITNTDNSKQYSFEHEETANFTSSAYPGFRFIHWETEDGNTSDGNWTNEILNDQNVTAVFQRIPYSINIALTDPSRGKLKYHENYVPEIDKVMVYGDTLSVTAEASEGYRFEKWLVAPAGIISNNKNPLLNLSIQQNMTISPLFVTIDNIPISISIQPEEAGFSVGQGEFPYNELHPIYAQSRKGWVFERWDGEEVASSISANTTILLDEPKVLKAIFKLKTEGTGSSGADDKTSSSTRSNLLVVTENENSFGNVSGSGFYGNEYVSIQATAFNGYEFVRWDGDEITDQYAAQTQVLVNKNKTVTAHFQKLGVFEDSVNAGNGWWSSGNFGFFFKVQGTEWFFHETLAWILMRQAEDNRNEKDSFWVWIDQVGTWAWMKKSKFPHMYAQGEEFNGWIWIDTELSIYPKVILYYFDPNGLNTGWKQY